MLLGPRSLRPPSAMLSTAWAGRVPLLLFRNALLLLPSATSVQNPVQPRRGFLFEKKQIDGWSERVGCGRRTICSELQRQERAAALTGALQEAQGVCLGTAQGLLRCCRHVRRNGGI